MLFKRINKVSNGRIIMKDGSRDVLQRKINRLRQYANQCRITGDLEEYREALKEIANLEEEFKNLMKNLQIKDAAAVALDQIRKLKRSMTEDTALGALDSLKKEVKRNTKDQDNEKIEAYGVKGNSNTKWRRIFSNRTEMMKWVESNNAEIQGTRKAEPNERVGNVDKKTKDEGKYKIYWINHNYYSQEEFNTLEEARKYADSKSFEYRIDLNGKPVVSGGTLRGFRRLSNTIKAI